jgi:hypothetical protein
MRIGKRHISKRLLLLVVVPVVLVFAGTGAVFAANGFTDIAGNTHEQSIIEMADRGITEGYPDGTFRPDNPVTRGQMMTFLDRYTSGMGCTDCHDDTNLMSGKIAQWELSRHGEGDVFFEEGQRSACAGCHSGGAFSAMIAAGKAPNQASADPNPSKQDCRACHEVHTTYTGADWALETTAPVAYYAIAGTTYDRGASNLCATCHQPRVDFPAASGGMVEVTSIRFGPHHGPHSAMLQGVAGAGLADSAGSHYNMIGEGCVTCHMGENAYHTFEPIEAACTPCHGEDFDMEELQTEVQGMADELQAYLLDEGMLDDDGYAVTGTYEEAKAIALWNYRTVIIEDRSLGVHNPNYVKAMLQVGLDAFE